MDGLVVIIFIIAVILVLVCNLDTAIITILTLQIFAIGYCVYKASNVTANTESFTPVSKTCDNDKYEVDIPENYDDIVNELENINYNIKNENYDNLMNLDEFSLSKPTTDTYEMLEQILKNDDETADYKAASAGIEYSKRYKQSKNIRSRLNSENIRKSFGLDEELDDTYNRRWFDRDQLDLEM